MASNFFITNCITLFSIIYIILVIILFFLKGKAHRVAGKVFAALIFMSLLATSMNLVSGTFASYENKYADFLGRITCFLTVCWNYLFVFYIAIVFKSNEENERFYSKYALANIIAGIVLFLFDLFMCIFLSIDYVSSSPGEPYIMQGGLNIFTGVMGFISLLYGIITAIVYRKKLDKLTIILGIYTILISTYSIVNQMVNENSINATSLLHVMVIMFLYLSIESQDGTLLTEFNESTKKAQENNKLKSEFIMNMSHQLRTPLNTILGFTDSLLLADNLDLSVLKDDTANIKVSSRKLLDLINAILDISKLESDKEIVNMDNYNLDTIIYDISSNINSKIIKENLMFTINANENCPNDLYGDGYKICKILNIIIMNAVNHTNYGEVSLNISSTIIDSLNHEICFHVKNSGHTMQQSSFDRSFEDLIKLTSENNDNIDADTLNLLVAKGLIDMLGGTIDFINETGMGTQYIIKIKQKLTSQNLLGNIKDKIQTRREFTHNIVNLLGKKALIIDDKDVYRTVLERLLGQYNITVDNSVNPREGIELVKNNKYDIIFINNDMKDLSGEEVHNILLNSCSELAPVVGLVTRRGDLSSDCNYDNVLENPIEFRELNKIMNSIFVE